MWRAQRGLSRSWGLEEQEEDSPSGGTHRQEGCPAGVRSSQLLLIVAGTEADLSGCRRGEGAFFHQGASGWCLQAMEIAPHHHRGGAGTQRRRCRRLALWGAGKGRGGPGRVLPGWGTPGGGVGVRSPRLGRRVLEQLGADGQGEAPSFLQRPPPLPASTMDGAEGEGRVPTMGWLHFGVLMPILHANSVRLIRVCSRVDSLRGLFPCSRVAGATEEPSFHFPFN